MVLMDFGGRVWFWEYGYEQGDTWKLTGGLLENL